MKTWKLFKKQPKKLETVMLSKTENIENKMSLEEWMQEFNVGKLYSKHPAVYNEDGDIERAIKSHVALEAQNLYYK